MPKTSKAKKNTTFCFTSKDIVSSKNLHDKSGHYFKRNSIRINDFQKQFNPYEKSLVVNINKQTSLSKDIQN